MKKENCPYLIEYFVRDYEEVCEEFSKIEKIIPLRKSYVKLFFYAILNLLTAFLINLFLVWYPTLQLTFIYSSTSLDTATFLGIFGSDRKFYVKDIERIRLPLIEDSVLKRFFYYSLPDSEVIIFSFKLFKYFYDPSTNDFTSVKFNIREMNQNIHSFFNKGLVGEEVDYQTKIFGKCDLDIEIDSIFMLTLKEVTDPFYLFQLFSIVLWLNNAYVNYAIVIIITSLGSLAMSIYESRANLMDIQQMAKYQCEINLFRNTKGLEKELIKNSSTVLVPGDLFELPDDGSAIPCDAILISGTVIINESMLTGESTPIIKTHLPTNNNIFDCKLDTKYMLYAGTKIVQKRVIGNNKVVAVVVATGFNTEKGNLIRSILFPKANEFQFQKDSVKYILFMALLSFIGFGISVPFMLSNGISLGTIFLRAFDMITTTVPPALPACIGIGISIALSRLKSKGIICIARERINVAGRVNMICFDKTGTLTEDHLDIYGYRPVKMINDSIGFDSFLEDLKTEVLNGVSYYKSKMAQNIIDKNKDLQSYFIENLASCHSITKVNDKLMGDPIDLEMFRTTGWIFNENIENSENYDSLISTFVRPPNEKDLNEKLSAEGIDEEEVMKTHYEMGIVRRFDFSSKLQRMSVIVKNVNEPYFKVYSKGSPEKIRDLCKPNTLPRNFNQILAKYTSKGLRVLALSMKMIKIDYMYCQKVDREKIENNMIFLGLLIVQNKLKEATKSSIETLHSAKLRMVMATGDNILTGISVAKECYLVKPDAHVIMCEIDKDGNKLKWNPVDAFQDDEENSFKSIHIQENPVSSIQNRFNRAFSIESVFSIRDKKETFVGGNAFDNKEALEVIDENQADDTDLEEAIQIDTESNPFKNHFETDKVVAISGSTFENLWKLKNKFVLTKDEKYKSYYEIFQLVLRYAVIYARMSPEHKTILVESLRQEEFTVCMCGDGANDCGALRAADVGVSLSLEEASIAAHFTSNIPDISCLIRLFREGKASLVTSIECFKYMMLYSLIQFSAVTLLIIFNSYLSDNQFLVSDLFIIFPLAVFIARTGAYHKLTHHQPTGALISLPIISSILLQSLIQFSSQLTVYHLLKNQHWYVPNEHDNSDEETAKVCLENTVIFLISNMQYLITAVAFSISRPFRKPLYTNFWLTAFLLFGFAFSFYLIIDPDSFNRNLLSIVEFGDDEFKYLILVVSLVNFIISYVVEKLFIPCIANSWKSYKNKKIKNLIMAAQTPFNLNQLYKIHN